MSRMYAAPETAMRLRRQREHSPSESIGEQSRTRLALNRIRHYATRQIGLPELGRVAFAVF